MQIGSWLRRALRALWQPKPSPLFIPPWSEMAAGQDDRVLDVEWGRALRRMAGRMERTWAVYQ